MTSKRDYYEILGIDKNTAPEDIKKAYRKLALEYHPDRNKEANAEEKFKEINEAYQVLGDAEKKQKYDQFGHSAFDPRSGMGQNPFAGGFQQGPSSWSYGGSQNPFAGGDFVDPFEIFNSFFGGGFSQNQERIYQTYSLRLTFMEAALGIEKTLDLDGKKRKIKIPAGVDDGTRIRFGKIHITFDVADDPYFKREGADVFVDIQIPLTTLILGGNIEIRTLTSKIKMKVREGTPSHTMVRLSQEGLANLQKEGKGNMYVKLIAQIPNKLNREQRKAVDKLREVNL